MFTGYGLSVVEERVRVGQIVKPHGIKGELIVEPLTEFVDRRFEAGSRLGLELEGELKALTVREARAHKERLIVQFDEVTDRDRAESLRDRFLTVSPEEIEELDEDEYYGFELVGLEVLNENGESMGTVREVAYPLVNPVLEIEHPRLGTIDFPADPQLVLEINEEEGWIRVRLPRGWRSLVRDE